MSFPCKSLFEVFFSLCNHFNLAPLSFVRVPLPPNPDLGIGITLVPVGLHLEQRLLLLIWSCRQRLAFLWLMIYKII